MTGNDFKKDFISQLYLSVLNREADESGFSSNMLSIQDPLDAKRLAEVAGDFARSEEYRKYVINDFLVGLASTLHDSSYSYFSIGDHCATASILKKFNQRNCSTPFDWIFSSLDMVSHCIEDDFSTFLDRSHYRSVGADQRSEKDANLCDHQFYLENFGVKFVFNHHDPLTEKDYAYFVRCIERFRLALNNPDARLIYLGRNPSVEEISRLDNALQGKACRAIVFNLHRNIAASLPHFEVAKKFAGVTVVDFFARSDVGAIGFTDPFDDFMFSHVVSKLSSCLA
ncbi:DUF1796 family putative cysteine peptidase [Pseudomonas oryzihabitans]|uniref:DUF1796 family putative cysteine peptidase n=1 Tax=Pseudomonas oryzihabitans TaxID=47885 RepID=UPI0015E2DE31|nr:DUF1796 family putative cysteine peptidase [Pseudomonas psychrotolerans]MBA1259186.1 hypothetical protein [Pseudomonas psychrotolerans]